MINAWLLTSPWPKSNFYETWRFIDEMHKRNLNTQHIHPDMCTVVGDDVFIDGQKIIPPDLVIMRHSVWNPDGLKKLGILRKHGTIFVTDIEPHIEALDKIYAHEKYVKANISLPKTIFVDITEDNASEQVGDIIGYPCVIKWRFAAGSEKVFLCLNEFEFDALVGNKMKFVKSGKDSGQFSRRLSSDPKHPNSKHNMTVVVQEYLDLNYMITAHSVRDRNIQGTMQAIPPHFKGYEKFQANFANAEGRVQLPINANSEMKDLINKSLEALNVEWGRVDIFPTKDGLKLCEVNPSANFPMTEACSLQNLAGHMVDRAIEKYQLLKR